MNESTISALESEQAETIESRTEQGNDEQSGASEADPSNESEAVASGEETEPVVDSGSSGGNVSVLDTDALAKYFGNYDSSKLCYVYRDGSDDIPATVQIINRLDSLVVFSVFNFVLLGIIVLIMIGRIFTDIFKDVINAAL